MTDLDRAIDRLMKTSPGTKESSEASAVMLAAYHGRLRKGVITDGSPDGKKRLRALSRLSETKRQSVECLLLNGYNVTSAAMVSGVGRSAVKHIQDQLRELEII